MTVSELVRKYKALRRECLARQRAKSERVLAANFVSGAWGDTGSGMIAWGYGKEQGCGNSYAQITAALPTCRGSGRGRGRGVGQDGWG